MNAFRHIFNSFVAGVETALISQVRARDFQISAQDDCPILGIGLPNQSFSTLSGIYFHQYEPCSLWKSASVGATGEGAEPARSTNWLNAGETAKSPATNQATIPAKCRSATAARGFGKDGPAVRIRLVYTEFSCVDALNFLSRAFYAPI